MQLGLFLSYWGASARDDTEVVVEAERSGYASVWTAEAYGSDAVAPLAWYGAATERIGLGTGVLQMTARAPAVTAMTAATLDHLSGGRLLLGLGVSGPQVVEGWHGVEYGRPLARTREYVEIVRAVLQREQPLEHDGRHYTIPVEGGTGHGKPLKLITHPRRAEIPIYLASVGPKNVALTAEIAHGWLPAFFAPEHAASVWGEALADGRSRRKLDTPLDVAVTCMVAIDDDVDEARDRLRPTIALYVGGMGASDRNFYADVARRYGFEEAIAEVQRAFLAGDRAGAMAAVPDSLVDAVALAGPVERIRDRLDAYREADVTTLLIGTTDIATVRAMAELI